MRIGRLQLHNFKSYEDAEVLFTEPLNRILADNTSGKTSLLQSILLSLTGQSEGTASDGKGAADKIRLGADKAIITTGLDTARGPMELVVSYPPATGLRIIHPGSGDDEKTVEVMAKGFERFLNVNRERLSCCLDSDFFINQKPAEQKAILAALVLTTSHDWEAKPEDAKMKALAAKHFPKTDWSRPPLVVIDEIYGDDKSGAYGARKTAKATLSGIHIPATPAKPEHDANEVQAKLNILRVNQTKEAKKVKQGGTVQVGRVEQNLTQARERLTRALSDLKAAQNKQVTIEADLLDGPTMTGHKQAAAKRKDYEAIGAQIADLDAEIAAQQQAQQIFAELLLDDDGKPVQAAHCPTCTQAITREFITDKVQQHANLEKAAQGDRQRLAEKQSKLGDIAGAEAVIKRQDEKTGEKLEAVKAITAAQERITFAENAVKDLEAALANAKAAEANPIDTSALDALTKELGEWEARLTPAVQYNSTLTQIEDAKKRAEAQQTLISEMETLCTFFGLKGIKARLIGENIGAFQDTVNSVISKWPEHYQIKIDFEPWSFMVTYDDIGPRWLPLKELSGFERLAFCASFQCAVAIASKIKMVLIDKLDTMAKAPHRQFVLLGALDALLKSKQLDQVITFATDLTPDKDIKHKPGVAYYRIVKADKKSSITRLLPA